MVLQLPWSTSNDDLIELFTTIGRVERAEIQYEASNRSTGSGVVQFDTAENAETAIGISPLSIFTCLKIVCLTLAAKFSGYQYGGRPLGLSFVKYANLSNGGDAMEAEPSMTQDQMM